MLIQLKKKIYLPLIALLSVAVFFSCKKNVDDTQITNTETPDLSSRVHTSVSGYVLDENNAPVQAAAVKVGDASASVQTNAYGYFEVNDVEVVKNAAVVNVSKAGYFHGIKTFAVTAGKSAFFRIKLIPKTIAGTVSSTSGGNITLSSGLIIGLPANGVVTASSNAAYSGNINVAVAWLNPEANDLTEIMPGDLRGLDENGAIKGLTTFGMTAVELSDDAGNLLQIASGKKATITMPLSATLSAAAPASIPLWYFNENNGLWKQEGSATKTGNTYVGEVSHFSWWNCDLPNAIVPLTFTVVDNSGNPVANAHVEITPTTSNSWSHIGGYTDSTGYVSVFVTPDASYDLEIYSSCSSWNGTPDYTQSFSVTTTAVDLGNIVLPASITAVITGTVTDCNGNPVTNGNVLVQNGWYYQSYTLDNTGSYSFSTVLCSGSTSINIIGEDLSSMQQSTMVTHTIVAGNNSIGNLQACGVSTNQFITWTTDGGSSITLTSPGDSLTQDGNPGSTQFYISGANYNTSPVENIQFSMNNTGIGVGSAQNLTSFYTSTIGAQTVITTPAIVVNITEYGAIGEYIAGNFSGTVLESVPPSTPHTVTCSFRIRRNF